MAGEAQRETSAAFVAALVVAAFFVAFGGLHYGFYTRKLLVDTPIYERYGDAIVHAQRLPYRDFAVEYPPGALPVFAAPSVVAAKGDFPRYRQLFEALMVVCGAVGSALVGFVLARQGAGRGRLVAGTLLAGLAPLALGPVVLSRFDLWPAALTIAALAALVAGRPRLGFVLLAVAVAAKVYPAVLLPLALVFVWRRAGRREAATCAGVFAAAMAGCILPFAIAAPHGVWSSLSGQANRPLQIESLGASFMLAAHHLWAAPLTESTSHGSDNLVGHVPHLLSIAQSLATIGALAAIWLGFARGPAERDRLLRFAAAAVCAFVTLDKVLSPQYLIWLIALVPLVRGRRGAAASALFVAAAILTQLWFPRHYISLAYGFDPSVSWLVLARDLTLVALLLTLAWPRGRSPRVAVVTVGALVAAGSAAAVTAAVVSAPAKKVPTHSGLLAETGVASSCGRVKRAPAATSGSVHYAATAFTSPARRRAACITVTLTSRPHLQLFSAAYRGRFERAAPRAHYLGDAGTCTNVPSATGSTLSYSLRARQGVAPVVIEVEGCTGNVPLLYTVEVRSGARAIGFAGATATRHGRSVVVTWRVTRSIRGLVFSVHRRRPAGAPVGAGRATASSVTDPHPVSRYWLRAIAPDGSWSWFGPIVARKP